MTLWRCSGVVVYANKNTADMTVFRVLLNVVERWTSEFVHAIIFNDVDLCAEIFVNSVIIFVLFVEFNIHRCDDSACWFQFVKRHFVDVCDEIRYINSVFICRFHSQYHSVSFCICNRYPITITILHENFSYVNNFWILIFKTKKRTIFQSSVIMFVFYAR